MNYRPGKTIVISLGGSIMCPEQIDVLFLKRFRQFILKRLKGGSPLRRRSGEVSRFVIVAGGGRICRVYQETAGKISKVIGRDKDWLGIHVTRLNAHLLWTMFREVADPVVIDGRDKIRKLRFPVTIASGWRPGWSTDYITVVLAKDLGVPEIIIAGKPAFVYDKDHQKYRDAKPLYNLRWRQYRRLIPKQWKPGLHSPVDPVAARLAEHSNIKAIVLNGKDLKNLSNLLEGKNFRGTIIS